MPGSRPSFRQISSYLAACAASSPTSGDCPHGARVRHRRAEHDPVEVVRHVVVVRDRRRVTGLRVPAAAQVRPPPAGRRQRPQRRPRPRARIARLATARGVSGTPRESAAQLERGEDVALDVEVAGDVRAPEAELAGRGERSGGSASGDRTTMRRRRIRRAPRGCRRTPRRPIGQVGPDDLFDEVGDGHGRSPHFRVFREPVTPSRRRLPAVYDVRSRCRRDRRASPRSVGSPPATARGRAARRGRRARGVPRSRRGRRRRAQMPDREAGEEAGAERGRLRAPVRSRPGVCVASASACTNVGLSVMPPSTRSAAIAMPVSASAASTRSAPRWAMPSSTARTISARPVPRVRPSSVPRAP